MSNRPEQKSILGEDGERQRTLRTNARTDENPGSIKPVNNEDFDFVEREQPADLTGNDTSNKPTPSYQFPRTWESAKSDTSKVAREIHSATKTYISTVADSGIGQAGLSVGGAFAETANRNALKLANHAVHASGASRDRLPSGFRNWLKGKEKLDAARKKAQDAEEARKEREIKRRLIARGEVVEAPMDSRSPSVEEFEIVNHPTRDDLARSESPRFLRHRELSFESTSVIGRTQQMSLSDGAADSKAPQTPANSDIFKNFDSPKDNQHHLRTSREISNARGTLPVEASPYTNSHEGAGFFVDEPSMSTSGTRRYSTTTSSTKGHSRIRHASLPDSRGEPARGETLRALVAENSIETSKSEEAEFVDEEIEQDGEKREDDRDDEYDFGNVGMFDEE